MAESAVAEEVVANGEEVGVIEGEELLARHRKEKKDLQAKIQALKKSATKGNTKKKKEVNDEITKLEAQMADKHTIELAQLQASCETDKIASEIENNLVLDDGPKVTKAQKRRDRKVVKQKEREQSIAEQEEANKLGARHIETEKILELLAQRDLTYFHVPADGHCMYVAIQHQLTPGCTHRSVQQLRKAAADYMRANHDEFMPFMDNTENESQFSKYCQEVEQTAAWGGQLELRALSQVLGRPIEVLQSEGRPITIGEHFMEEKAIILTYHRHMFGLGEHYNSVQPMPAESKDEFQ